MFTFFVSERNAKMKRNGRDKCEIFAKRLFLFIGKPCWESRFDTLDEPQSTRNVVFIAMESQNLHMT